MTTPTALSTRPDELLTAVSAPQVEEIEKTNMELLRLRFDEQVRSEKRKSAGTAIESAAGVSGGGSTATGLVGAKVTATLEVEAEISSGVPDHVVRTDTENSRTLKFKSQGFETE